MRYGVIAGMFDRAWVILCRDASQPVGYVRMLRANPEDARGRIDRARTGTVACAADGHGECRFELRCEEA